MQGHLIVETGNLKSFKGYETLVQVKIGKTWSQPDQYEPDFSTVGLHAVSTMTVDYPDLFKAKKDDIKAIEYRVVLSKNKQILATSNTFTQNLDFELVAKIQKLYADQKAACKRGSDACFEFTFAHEYPGLVNLSDSQKEDLKSKYTWKSFASPNKAELVKPSIGYSVKYADYGDQCDIGLLNYDPKSDLPGNPVWVKYQGKLAQSFETNDSEEPRASDVVYLDGEIYWFAKIC